MMFGEELVLGISIGMALGISLGFVFGAVFALRVLPFLAHHWAGRMRERA